MLVIVFIAFFYIFATPIVMRSGVVFVAFKILIYRNIYVVG